MSPHEKKTMRLMELLSRRWDDMYTDDDNRELEGLLRELGPEGGEALVNASKVHLELGKHVASAKANQRAMASINATVQEEDAAGQHTVASRQSSLASTLARPWVISTVAAAVLLALGVQYINWYSTSSSPSTPSLPRVTRLLRPSKPVGNLVSVNQAVWAEGSEVQTGDNLDENRHLELVSGRAQISMAYGADLVLQAPCSVTLVSHDFVQLNSGVVTAQVAKWARGFRVSASDLEIVDLGTRFALKADTESGVVEAHVLEGSVLAEPLKKRRPQQSRTLNSGEGIRVDGPHATVDLIDARRQEFVDELESFRPLCPIDIWNTGMGASLGADDPHWTITAGSEDYGPYPRPATITDGDTRSYEDNKPEISQWISVSAKGYPGVPPESTHTFETTFDLTGYDLDTVYVVGYFLVDDAINELRINGHPVEFKRWVTTWDVFDFKSFHPIEITDHFVEGKNVISIDVFNSPSRPETPQDPNPTALRVEWQAFGCAIGE